MNLTAFLANKCFEYLLRCEAGQETGLHAPPKSHPSGSKEKTGYSIKPPWSGNSEDFQAACDACGDCIKACSNNILVPGKSGRPRVDFSQGDCTFCGSCAESCRQGALLYKPSGPPWRIKAKINKECLAKNNVICSICAEQCEKRVITLSAISEGNREPQIMTESCNGCGACYRVCPVQAIEMS